jgi:membrane peptidoglycan carboxypeptidase
MKEQSCCFAVRIFARAIDSILVPQDRRKPVVQNSLFFLENERFQDHREL